MPKEAFADRWATLEGAQPWSARVEDRRNSGDHHRVRANGGQGCAQITLPLATILHVAQAAASGKTDLSARTGQMDQATPQNAAMVEQRAAAAQSLKAQAPAEDGSDRGVHAVRAGGTGGH